MVGDSSAVSGKGWFKTHPTPEQRIEKVKTQVVFPGAYPGEEPVRTKRFQQTLAGLK
jgi:hypothetical protein